MTMLDTLTHSPTKARSRYPIFSDAAIGLRSADLAMTLPLAKGEASGLRRTNDPAKISSNRRSIARHCDQTAARLPLDANGRYESLEPLSKLAMVANEELTRFYNIVCHAGYVLRFCSNDELAIDPCGELADRSHLLEWRSETSDHSPRPVEKQKYGRTERPRPPAQALDRQGVETHGGSRYRAGVSAANCEVPVFDPAGNFVGSLEILSIDPKQPVPVDRMTRALLQAAARAIEERLFREQYRREWIVMASPDEVAGSAMLFAVDRSQNIVAADRYARSILTEHNNALEAIVRGDGISLWTLFEKDLTLFRSKELRDIPTQLIPAGTAESWSALITPPDGDLTPWRELDANLHTRPRIGEIGFIRQLTSAPVARGGLSPSVLRRVREYIDANLEANIGLDEISKVAGLSRCHFVRAFRQSVGTTPHNFLMYRRFCKAVDFITSTDLPLAEIALAAGFSDQSHFSRRFRQYLGVSPSAFRRSQR
jgi:AraC-like DNA-binding protein